MEWSKLNSNDEPNQLQEKRSFDHEKLQQMKNLINLNSNITDIFKKRNNPQTKIEQFFKPSSQNQNNLIIQNDSISSIHSSNAKQNQSFNQSFQNQSKIQQSFNQSFQNQCKQKNSSIQNKNISQDEISKSFLKSKLSEQIAQTQQEKEQKILKQIQIEAQAKQIKLLKEQLQKQKQQELLNEQNEEKKKLEKEKNDRLEYQKQMKRQEQERIDVKLFFLIVILIQKNKKFNQYIFHIIYGSYNVLAAESIICQQIIYQNFFITQFQQLKNGTMEIEQSNIQIPSLVTLDKMNTRDSIDPFLKHLMTVDYSQDKFLQLENKSIPEKFQNWKEYKAIFELLFFNECSHQVKSVISSMQKNKNQKPFYGKLRMFTPEKRNSYDDFTYFEVRDQQKENISK